MGTVNIAYTKAMATLAPVMFPPRLTENVTTSGTAVSATGSPKNGEVVIITAKDVSVAVKFNSNSTVVAATATDFLIMSGATREFGGFSGGESLSIVEV